MKKDTLLQWSFFSTDLTHIIKYPKIINCIWPFRLPNLAAPFAMPNATSYMAFRVESLLMPFLSDATAIWHLAWPLEMLKEHLQRICQMPHGTPNGKKSLLKTPPKMHNLIWHLAWNIGLPNLADEKATCHLFFIFEYFVICVPQECKIF